MERKVDIRFEPVEHKYTDETGLVYTSATTLIGKYKKKFNNYYWSMYTALKNKGYKVKQEDTEQIIYVNNVPRNIKSLWNNNFYSNLAKEVLVRWQVLTDVACARGNEIHDFLEDSINLSKDDEDGISNDAIQPNLRTVFGNEPVILKTKHDLDKTQIGKRFPEIYDKLKGYIDKGLVLYAEKRVYSTTYQIAGMIDVLIVNPYTKQFAILDWKTNKDAMHFHSGYYKKKKMPDGTYIKTDKYIPKVQKLLYPVQHMDECKGMIYSLQLSLYAYIMELWGYTLADGLVICHVRPGLRPKFINIDYKKKEIISILQHHKQSLNGGNTNNSIFTIR